MKGIPLWQPYASLIAVGAKRVETRHWPTPTILLGERVAIFATKGGMSKRDETAHLDQAVFRTALVDAGIDVPFDQPGRNLPRSAIVCTVVIDRCREITPDHARQLAEINPAEYAFGNYDLDDGPRFGWVLRDVERLDPIPFAWPVQGPAKYIEVPDDLLGAAPASDPIAAQGVLL